MDIQSLSGHSVQAVAGTTPTTSTSPPPTPSLDGTLSTVSQMLGMSLSSVQTALRSGRSVNDLITQTGASQSSIVSAVENQIQQARQTQGLPPVDQGVLDRLVNRAFERHRNVPIIQPPAGGTPGTATTPSTPETASVAASAAAAATSTTSAGSGSGSGGSSQTGGGWPATLPYSYRLASIDPDAGQSGGLSIIA